MNLTVRHTLLKIPRWVPFLFYISGQLDGAEVNSSSASQEIPCILCNLKVHYCKFNIVHFLCKYIIGTKNQYQLSAQCHLPHSWDSSVQYTNSIPHPSHFLMIYCNSKTIIHSKYQWASTTGSWPSTDTIFIPLWTMDLYFAGTLHILQKFLKYQTI